jgi:PiT family inorganic phosphate transporter
MTILNRPFFSFQKSSPQATFYKLSLGLLFLVLVALYTFVYHAHIPQLSLLLFATVVGGYMAMNIGANDVANNMGPAVGSKTLTLASAILIAALFESSGALIAGGDVVNTIKKGIIDPDLIVDTQTFIWIMLAALLGGALWVHLATALGAPISTTHSVVGGVMGAGITASGWAIVDWAMMTKIAASWVISPILGGIIAAFFLYIIQDQIFHKENTWESAQKVVPILIGIMGFAFASYLVIKGIKKVVKLDFTTVLIIGVGIGILTYMVTKPLVIKASLHLSNAKSDINKLFTLPLIFAVALLSFAHGANDVANAIGPLAAIYEALQSGLIVQKATIPIWIMVVGAFGIAIGLATYGPKLIKTVGSEITELDQARAWSIAMSSAIVVIIASWLGLPVSSTHIAIGGVFGVGYLRYYLYQQYENEVEGIKAHHVKSIRKKMAKWSDKLEKVTDAIEIQHLQKRIAAKKQELSNLDIEPISLTNLSKKEIQRLAKIEMKHYVRHELLIKIIAAWLITVPVSAFLASLIYLMLVLGSGAIGMM